jgi:outer membrane protein OmpU
MRRTLLGSTALAAALASAAATAAEGVELEIGGRYKGAAGVVLSEDFSASSEVASGDIRGYVFKQDVEIDLEGEAELDNGLTVGVAIQLQAQTDIEDQISDVYAFFEGDFGELRFGDTEEAYAQLCYQVPTASELFGADSPDFNFSNASIAGYAATNGTCYGIDDNATKVVYFSPEFAGFQFAASFAPDASEDTRNTLDGAGTRFRNDAEQNSETLSVAASFAPELDAMTLILGGGATFSFDKESNPNDTGKARGYNAYARIGFSGLVLGAAAELRENFGDDGADQWVYGAGATYGWSAWTVGLGWTRGDYGKAVGANDSDPFNAGHDIYSATASYALAPGISIDGVIEYSDYGSNDAAGPDYQGLAAGLGTLIAF